MLRDYLNGISVNEEVMSNANPLMVINRAPGRQTKAGGTNGKGLVEAVVAMRQRY
jgi:hypothetical protein